MQSLTEQQIRAIYGPNSAAIAEAYRTRGEAALKKAGILDSETRLAFFLAQTAYETGPHVRLEENLTYRTAARILEVWPKRFADEADAAPFVRNKEALADRVYGNRADLGNDQPGDGWRYRGRGLIQITGKANYREVGEAIGIDLVANPDKAADPAFAWDVAAGWWTVNDVNEVADRGSLDKVTAIINRYTDSYEERRTTLARVRRILAATSTTSSAGFAFSDTGGHGTAATVIPTPAAAGVPMSHDEVKGLQNLLKAKNYAVGKSDGIFGTLTAAAVLAFQRDHGLPVTGMADAKTLAALAGAPDRQLSAGRVGATTATLRAEGSTIILTLDKARIVGWIATALGALGLGKTAADVAANSAVGAVTGGVESSVREVCAFVVSTNNAPAAVLEGCAALGRTVQQAVEGGGIGGLLTVLTTPGASGTVPLVDLLVQFVGPFIPFGGASILSLVGGLLVTRLAGKAQERRVEDHRQGLHLGR
ncbi:peptidoglycan-binding protein [Mongoliimonas terrestris]|uniref:peptidoglycan-binding protein n=1 Tax=Mongoliimonas terrestris TaxID=1709001 RepID=UPI000949891B|nr:peptidoglycan-binding protein [Mongoliimonas terrestris]